MNKYRDIMDKTRPVSAKHPPMAAAQRAKLFVPFSALRGYEEAIASCGDFFIFPSEPAEEKQKELDGKIRLLRSCLLSDIPAPVSVTVFRYKNRGKGCYATLCGQVTDINISMQQLFLNGKPIPFTAIHELEGAVFANNESATL